MNEEENTMEQLLEILKGIRPEIDFEKEQELIDKGVLDSFDIILLVGELNDAFNIEIGVEHFLPENFNSLASIYQLVQDLQK